MRFHVKRRRMPVMNIISLIDILVILLIFFIVTTVFRREEPMIEITPPQSTKAKPASDNPPTIVYADKDGKLFIGSEEIDPATLKPTLEAKVAANASFKIALKADKKAPFQSIISVMDAARDAGIQGTVPTFMEDAPK